MKRFLGLVVLLAAITVVALPFLGPRRDEGVLPELGPYQWANPLKLPSIPADAYAAALWNDPVERAVRRLEWGTPDVVHWTQQNPPEPVDRFRRRIEERVPRIARSSLVARTLLETLGVIGDERSVPLLLEYAQQDPDYLQLSALQALRGCRLDDEAETVLAVLSGHTDPQIAAAARRAVVDRPEAWDVETLRAYLTGLRGPEVHPILDRVGEAGIRELADAVALHLDERDLAARRVAIRALMRFDDARGFAAARAELGHVDDGRRLLALTLYRDVGSAPPLELAQSLARHPNPEMRRSLAQALAGATEQTRDAAIELLQSIADTEDAVLRETAVRVLRSLGHHESLGEYRDRVREGHGESLKEAVRFLCENLGDPSTAPLLRARLAEPDLDPVDVANLLFGLRFIGDPTQDTLWYVDSILRGGTAEDRRSVSTTYLSEFASLYVQTFGQAAVAELLGAMPQATTDRARQLILDALRGCLAADGGTPEVLAALEGWAGEQSWSLETRLAVLDTLVFARTPEVGGLLRRFHDEGTQPELVQRARQLVLCYF